MDSTVSGGATNKATGDSSTVSGGGLNTASGVASIVVGGSENIASGAYSVAAGSGAKADQDHCMVFNASTDTTSAADCMGLPAFIRFDADHGVRFDSIPASTPPG